MDLGTYNTHPYQFKVTNNNNYWVVCCYGLGGIGFLGWYGIFWGGVGNGEIRFTRRQ